MAWPLWQPAGENAEMLPVQRLVCLCQTNPQLPRLIPVPQVYTSARRHRRHVRLLGGAPVHTGITLGVHIGSAVDGVCG